MANRDFTGIYYVRFFLLFDFFYSPLLHQIPEKQ